jgi:hypothetical protein
MRPARRSKTTARWDHDDLVERAYRSVQYHENPMCDGIKIPANY